MLLESYAIGIEISNVELELLDMELYSQLESIKISNPEGCLEVAPDHICKACLVCSGSRWITCLAAVLDLMIPVENVTKVRGIKVFDCLVKQGYLIVD